MIPLGFADQLTSAKLIENGFLAGFPARDRVRRGRAGVTTSIEFLTSSPWLTGVARVASAVA